jgi:2-haloacid dehalogenase
MSHPTPKAVVFDLGKVLLDFDYGILARRVAPHIRLTSAEFRSLVDQTPLLHRYETGLSGDREFFDEVVSRSGFQGEYDTFAAWFGDIFTEIPPMVALQEELRRRGVPTFVFSNTNAMAIAHVRKAFPFFGGFTGEILSYEVGSMKPDVRIYEALERLSNLSGADLLYLDDRAENIEAGLARGWQGWIHDDPAVTVPRVLQLFG